MIALNYGYIYVMIYASKCRSARLTKFDEMIRFSVKNLHPSSLVFCFHTTRASTCIYQKTKAKFPISDSNVLFDMNLLV